MQVFLSAIDFVQIMEVREAVEDACDSQALNEIQTQVKLHSIFHFFLLLVYYVYFGCLVF